MGIIKVKKATTYLILFYVKNSTILLFLKFLEFLIKKFNFIVIVIDQIRIDHARHGRYGMTILDEKLCDKERKDNA